MAALRVPSDGSFDVPSDLKLKGARGRPKVADSIISELRADIASGKLALGSRLPNERDLAHHFGVSQPTVREAMRALEVMGLIEVRHGSGAYITDNVGEYVSRTLRTLLQMHDVGVFEALELRAVLGAFSAEHAAANATPDEIADIEKAERACDEADTIASMAQAVVTFQAACSAAAHSPLLFALETFLVKILMQLELAAEGDRGEEFWRAQTTRFSAQRRKLLKCISAGDSPGAVRAMRSYLERQRQWFSADTDMSTVTLADPAMVWAVNEIPLRIPNYNPASRSDDGETAKS